MRIKIKPKQRHVVAKWYFPLSYSFWEKWLTGNQFQNGESYCTFFKEFGIYICVVFYITYRQLIIRKLFFFLAYLFKTATCNLTKCTIVHFVTSPSYCATTKSVKIDNNLRVDYFVQNIPLSWVISTWTTCCRYDCICSAYFLYIQKLNKFVSPKGNKCILHCIFKLIFVKLYSELGNVNSLR